MKIASDVWYDEAVWASFTRTMLAPASAVFRGVTNLRNTLYDRGVLSSTRAPIPVVSVGNLAVGGTGKTPVSAWLAGELRARGAKPAVIMRGYGDDETRVHALLNPDVPVIVNRDRVTGVRDAAARGADVGVLDDAFQHRSIARAEDIVLVSADRWREPLRVLPSGPWRELPPSLRRASLVMVTRKAADPDTAKSLVQRLAPLTRTGRGVVTSLELGDLRNAVTGTTRPLSDVRGTRVLLIAGIADPSSFALQLRNASADIEARIFPDHYSYDSADVARLVDASRSFHHVVCTLKDAVKLGPQWPREAPPLWYVSLRCRIESGSADMFAMIDRLLGARSTQLK